MYFTDCTKFLLHKYRLKITFSQNRTGYNFGDNVT